MNPTSITPNPRNGRSLGEAIAGLDALHSLSLAIDASGRILWMSDELGRAFGGSASQLGHEWTDLIECASGGLGASQLHRRLLDDLDARLQVELLDQHGSPERFDVSALDLGDASSLALVLRPHTESTACDALRSHALIQLLDALPDGVIALDASGHVFFANQRAAALFDSDVKELIDRPIAKLLGLREELGSADSTRAIAIEIDDARGRQRLDLHTRPLEIGDVMGRLVTLSNPGPARAEAARLEQKVAELESYVDSVSHDLRSPLVSLLGFTRLLEQDYADVLDETGRHFLHRIEQAGHSMDALISDLLEISKIGRPGETRDLINPRDVLQQLHAELKPRLEDAGVRLDIPGDPPLLLCNRTRLYQVFSNLIGNALAHMGDPDDPQIRVEVRSEDGCDHIIVSDNGRGIELESQSRIFEKFQTVRSSGSGSGSSGMGLAIVRKIAETHGGRVWVESEPGCGADFHVILSR